MSQTLVQNCKPTLACDRTGREKPAAVPKENCHLAKIVLGVETSVKHIPVARSHLLIPQLRSTCKWKQASETPPLRGHARSSERGLPPASKSALAGCSSASESGPGRERARVRPGRPGRRGSEPAPARPPSRTRSPARRRSPASPRTPPARLRPAPRTHLCTGGNSSISRRATERDLGCKPDRRPSCCRAAPALRHGLGAGSGWARPGQGPVVPRPGARSLPRSLPAVLPASSEPQPPWGGGGVPAGGRARGGGVPQSRALLETRRLLGQILWRPRLWPRAPGEVGRAVCRLHRPRHRTGCHVVGAQEMVSE